MMLCIVGCSIREVGKESVLFGGWGGVWVGASRRTFSRRMTSGPPSLAPSWPQRASPLHFRSSVALTGNDLAFPLPTSFELTSLFPSSTSSVHHHALYTSLLQTPTLSQLHFLFNHPRRLQTSLSQSLAACTSRILQPVQLLQSDLSSNSTSSSSFPRLVVPLRLHCRGAQTSSSTKTSRPRGTSGFEGEREGWEREEVMGNGSIFVRLDAFASRPFQKERQHSLRRELIDK
ncbi:hypothetical protein BDY24DRAFT_152376 [Mrakia frigida]|uniref:uncharacterized protein n=1 Tax=Mrakia frigida TaxID=29902 RepID=UPI003FCC249B